MWPFKKKKNIDSFEYTPEEQKIIDKANECTGLLPFPKQAFQKILNKQIELDNEYRKRFDI